MNSTHTTSLFATSIVPIYKSTKTCTKQNISNSVLRDTRKILRIPGIYGTPNAYDDKLAGISSTKTHQCSKKNNLYNKFNEKKKIRSDDEWILDDREFMLSRFSYIVRNHNPNIIHQRVEITKAPLTKINESKTPISKISQSLYKLIHHRDKSYNKKSDIASNIPMRVENTNR